jgi:nucleotide-binding universal stress UspA family protein
MTQHIKRILYATDLSDNSAYAFGYAINLAKKYDAAINVLHVIDQAMESSADIVGVYFNVNPYGGDLQQRMTHLHEEINKRLKAYIEKEMADNPEAADKVASVDVCKGYPANEIIQKADDLQCDLIVMGTHGKGVLSQAFFGSVAKKVLRRVRIPVFIVPLPQE